MGINWKKKFFYQIIIVVIAVMFITSCTSFDVGFVVQSGRPPETKKPQPPPPQEKPTPTTTAKEKAEQPAVPEKPIEEKPSSEQIAKTTPPRQELPEKTKPPKKETTAPEETAVSEDKGEKTASPQKPEIQVIAGIVTIEKNNYYIIDPVNKIRYRLVGLKNDEKKELQKHVGKKVKVEIKVLTTKSAKAYNTQLIRLL